MNSYISANNSVSAYRPVDTNAYTEHPRYSNGGDLRFQKESSPHFLADRSAVQANVQLTSLFEQILLEIGASIAKTGASNAPSPSMTSPTERLLQGLTQKLFKSAVEWGGSQLATSLGLGTSTSGGSSAAGGATGSSSLGGWAAAVSSAVNSARNFERVPDENKVTYAKQRVALAVADYYTFGAASMLEGFARSQWGGTMAKLDKLDQRFNLSTVAMNAILEGLNVFGSKDEHQKTRDQIRLRMQQLGLATEEFSVLGGDIGKDGGFRFADGRKIYEHYAGQEDGTGVIDDHAAAIIPQLSPLALLISGGDERATGYASGMLFNALKENSIDGLVTREEIAALYTQMGVSREDVTNLVVDLFQQKRITEHDASVALHHINLSVPI